MPYRICAALAAALLLSGCDRNERAEPGAAPTSPTAASTGTAVAASATANIEHAHHPSIDCPLRQQGIDPNSLRPFEDVEKYIAFLERPDRAVWQKPDAVVKALRLAADDVVVDLGAGSGYFAFRFARALPAGKVVAVDVEPEMVRHIHHKAMTEGMTNIQAVVAKSDEPPVTAEADLVFICDVLHHVSDRAAWLGRVFNQLQAGARIVLIEFKEGDLPEGPPANVKLRRSELEKLVRQAGFSQLQTDDELLPYQTMVQAAKLAASSEP
jgi:SAM-dependent methyltransferase